MNETEAKLIMCNIDDCSGCRVCELACSMEHTGEYNPKKSLIRIMANETTATYIPVLRIECNFCGRCIEACPMEVLMIRDLDDTVAGMKNMAMGSFPLPFFPAMDQ
ncbi:MAG: 4Fe-4S binding protein [Deltaproteobacteria bacterium]|nr:4Fe-4S binding protein [Deltaproteobacteria bacterium]